MAINVNDKLITVNTLKAGLECFSEYGVPYIDSIETSNWSGSSAPYTATISLREWYENAEEMTLHSIDASYCVSEYGLSASIDGNQNIVFRASKKKPSDNLNVFIFPNISTHEINVAVFPEYYGKTQIESLVSTATAPKIETFDDNTLANFGTLNYGITAESCHIVVRNNVVSIVIKFTGLENGRPVMSVNRKYWPLTYWAIGTVYSTSAPNGPTNGSMWLSALNMDYPDDPSMGGKMIYYGQDGSGWISMTYVAEG